MAVDLSSLLSSGVILPVSSANSRKHAVMLLCDALGQACDLDARDIQDAVMERERLGSTGVGEGVAIPHARIEGLEAPVGGFVRLEEGVDFEAIDDTPCDLIFMLLAPQSAGADHLRALAQVSRAFRQGNVRDALRKADTADEICAVLCQMKTSDAA